MKKLKLISAIYCEAARLEQNGKYILIGASSGSMSVADVPVVIPMTIFMEVLPPDKGDFNFHFRVLDSSSIVLMAGNLGMSFTGVGAATIALGTFPLNVQKAGKYLVQWSFDEKKWETIKELDLIIGAG